MTDTPDRSAPRVLTSPLAASMFTFAVFALVLTRVFLAFPLIPDYDSYFHLAAAREYAIHGEVPRLEWTRASLMAESFGDKEFAFHWLLTPLVSFMNPSTGGRLALALLNALIAAVIANLAVRAIGAWGIAIAPLLFLGAADLMARSFRLRPEIGSLILLLLIIPTAARRRRTTLAILSAVYALAYTGFHVAIGLTIIFVVADWITRRRTDVRLIGASILGSAAGILIHPQFPSNAWIWLVQNVLFFQKRSSLDIGAEMLAPHADTILKFNVGWWLALVLIWQSAAPREEPEDEDPMSWYFGIAATVFGVLWLLWDRMSIYFIPFATMAVLFEMRRRGLAPSAWSRAGRLRIPLAVGLLVAIALNYPSTMLVLDTLRTRGMSESDVAAMASLISPGAKVAAPWGETEQYVFWAPTARYLNVLNPIFMEAKNREVFEASESVFSGDEPDTPELIHEALDSEFVAFVRNRSTSTLESRLRGDPRVETLYAGQNYLGQVHPERAAAFIRDWQMKSGHPVSAPTGWVELTDGSTAMSPCATVVHESTIDAPMTTTVEIASWGPAVVLLDDEVIVATRAPGHAILGRGLIVPIEWEPGLHTITVQTCEDGSRNGFYALKR